MTYIKEMALDVVCKNPCWVCESEAVFLCSRCRRARFCSFGCQQKVWKEHRKECLESSGDETWVVLYNTDAFPGQDVGVVTVGLEHAKAVCAAKGYEGMVTWQGKHFLRKQSVGELVAAAQHVQGTHLWLPARALRLLAAEPLPDSVPEVLVPGALAVPKRSGLSVREMDENFRMSRPVVLTDAQQGWRARQKWSFQWLAAEYGREMMPCSDLAPFFRHCDRGRIRTVQAPLGEFVRYVLGEPSAFQALSHRVFYANGALGCLHPHTHDVLSFSDALRGWAPFLDHPELLADVSDRLYCVSDCVPTGDGPAKVFNSISETQF